MSGGFLKLDLSRQSQDFECVCVEPGLPLLDKGNTNFRILSQWFGRLLAEPQWIAGEDCVELFVHDDNQNRRVNIHCEPASLDDFRRNRELADEFAELATRMKQAEVDRCEVGIYRAIVAHFKSVIKSQRACYFFKYREAGHWRLVWGWGYQCRSLAPASPLICSNPNCGLLFLRHMDGGRNCPSCERLACSHSPVMRRSHPALLLKLPIVMLAEVARCCSKLLTRSGTRSEATCTVATRRRHTHWLRWCRWDNVDCTVYAPPKVERGDECFIQVFVHKPKAAVEAQELATAFDESAVRRGVASLETEIKRGSRLQFHLTSSRLNCDDPVSQLVWRGRTASVQFIAQIPNAERAGSVAVTVTVSQDSVPIGRITFKLAVVEHPCSKDTELVQVADASVFNTFFISYASKDRSEVLKRLQMLDRMGKRYFQDVLHLEPGDRWQQKLYLKIDESDAVLLFWSSNAMASEWVIRECQYAVEKKGIDFILPVIIEGPPPAEPPEELKQLHMNDRLLYFMRD